MGVRYQPNANFKIRRYAKRFDLDTAVAKIKIELSRKNDRERGCTARICCWNFVQNNVIYQLGIYNVCGSRNRNHVCV